MSETTAKKKTPKKKSILLLNGPNLNLLGTREPEKYGSTTLAQIEDRLRLLAERHGIELETFQSNNEGDLIQRIHEAAKKTGAILFNPGAFTHTSVALADAIAAVQVPTVEVHLSNIYKREEFRHHSYIAPVAAGQISGFGAHGYELAFYAAVRLMGLEPRD